MKNYGYMVFGGFFLLLCCLLPAAAEESFPKDSPLLNYVPENTAFFSGNSQMVNPADFPEINPGALLFGHSYQPFFYALFAEQDKSAMAFYSVDLLPVLKVIVSDKQVLLDALTKMEKTTGLSPQPARFQGLTFQMYLLDAVYPREDAYQLIVFMQEQADKKWLVTVAVIHHDTTAATKALIFGLTLAQPSVKRKVQAIQQDNQFLPVLVNFIDIKKALQALYHNKQYLKNNVFVQSLQSKACEKDILSLLDDRPELVAGYKQFKLKDQRVSIKFEALLKLKNQELASELSAFRGFIPQYIRQGSQENILALGLGLDLSQVSPFFIYLSQVMRRNSFQCAPLKALQHELASLNPLSLAMMTGVVDGIHGVSFALQEFSLAAQTLPQKLLLKQSQKQYKNSSFQLSAVISLAAEEPLKVWQMISALLPQAAAYKPSNTPLRVTIPQLDAMGIEVFLALKGQHLVLYTGAKGEQVSQQLALEKLLKNALLQESFNYTKATQAVKDLRHLMASGSILMANAALPAETCLYLDESIATLAKNTGWFNYQNDFTEAGWQHLLSADIKVNTIGSPSYPLSGKYAVYSVQDGCQLARDGVEELLPDGTGLYQQYSQNRQCFIAEVRYRWAQKETQMLLQYVSEHRRSEGLCSNDFSDWAVPEAEFINDTCVLRKEPDSEFSCLYQWDGILHKSVYKRL